MVRQLELPLWDYELNQGKEKLDKNNFLISVQFESEEKLMESRLFTLKLKACIDKWHLNLFSSDIFTDDIKNTLKTYIENLKDTWEQTRERGRGCICGIWWSVFWGGEPSWRDGVRSSQKNGNDLYRSVWEKYCEN